MAKRQRIASVDILRGMTIVAMILVNTPGDWNYVYAPLLHAEWHGLTPTDLVFPFFLFLVGVSIYFAYKNKNTSAMVYKKVVIRSVKLIVLGLFLNWFTIDFPFIVELSTARIPGVLQRIGIVFLITSILYLNGSWKVLLGVSISLLIGYWLFLGFVPFPHSNGALPSFDRVETNWVTYLDRCLLGSHMWRSDYDPEGVFSTLPAVVSCLIGVLVGRLLDMSKELVPLVFTGFAMLLIGYAFSTVFPINKALWSSSFVLVSSGWGVLFLSGIYYLVDIRQVQFGTLFKYIGMNAITLYFLSIFINKVMYLVQINKEQSLHDWVFRSVFVNPYFSLEFSSFLYAFCVVCFYALLAYVMAKRKIFIKI
ncbi:acyltransferase family protein [Cognatitamlana onchidii]|uniref:acyltransferase family protein n=1 Tax=Cognatitamlana onchidii TaxID=2562860 RepID=UPI0010A6224F|nr:heparan-alpha-glucosaminide N-acetyltransferase domain-containing protein [Algibacter onchidii]